VHRLGGPSRLSSVSRHSARCIHAITARDFGIADLNVVNAQAGLKADTVTYSALVSACEKVGDWERAWELYRQCRDSGVVPDTILYNSLISACDKVCSREIPCR